MPIASMTLSDGHGPEERALSRPIRGHDLLAARRGRGELNWLI